MFYAVFVIMSIGIAFVGSFHVWNPLRGTFEFNGIENYVRLFADPLLVSSLFNTVIFALISVLFRIIFGLGIAVMLYSRLSRAKIFYRTVFYMPTITPLIAVAFVWTMMLDPEVGPINEILNTNINWLNEPSTAMLSVIAMTIWKDFGYAVVMFLAGLISLPKDCFEAAEIDGANARQVFTYITLPLLQPTMLFVVITSLIGYFQAYIQILIMTEGGPGTVTYTLPYMIYEEAFENYNFGYASAISFVLFVLVSIVSAISFKTIYKDR